MRDGTATGTTARVGTVTAPERPLRQHELQREAERMRRALAARNRAFALRNAEENWPR